jgi:hypothetical protein
MLFHSMLFCHCDCWALNHVLPVTLRPARVRCRWFRVLSECSPSRQCPLLPYARVAPPADGSIRQDIHQLCGPCRACLQGQQDLFWCIGS